MEFSAWASDSCSFVLKKVRSADSATAVVVQGLEGSGGMGACGLV